MFASVVDSVFLFFKHKIEKKLTLFTAKLLLSQTHWPAVAATGAAADTTWSSIIYQTQKPHNRNTWYSTTIGNLHKLTDFRNRSSEAMRAFLSQLWPMTKFLYFLVTNPNFRISGLVASWIRKTSIGLKRFSRSIIYFHPLTFGPSADTTNNWRRPDGSIGRWNNLRQTLVCEILKTRRTEIGFFTKRTNERVLSIDCRNRD